MTATLFIDGRWSEGSGGRSAPVHDPATGEVVGMVSFAEPDDLDRALAAAQRAFPGWKATSAFERCAILRRAAESIRTRVEEISAAISLEQGKPLAEARVETLGAADHIDWNAEEGRRIYGRVIPSRSPSVTQVVMHEPVGAVAGFSPWNFPLAQLVRKVASALATGCTIIAKAPEETPTSAMLMVECFVTAGVPDGVLNLVFGVPSEISEHLIASPVIAKVSFTGSVPVGRHLSALAGRHLKRTTMELGGHAPFLVCEDADAEDVALMAVMMKFRNAGQVCASPTRFLVHEAVFEYFVDGFVRHTEALKVGAGLEPGTQMGPLAHARRVDAIDAFVRNAVDQGATLRTGGRRIGNTGYFYQPTVLTDVPQNARIMNEEPFGPVAVVNRFSSFDAMIEEANRLPYGLSAYAFTKNLEQAERIGSEIQSGTISINHFGLALPETPFGGLKDSGHGSEGGSEGLEAYLLTKFVTRKRD